MKLLLYCTQAKPNIVKGLDNKFYISNAWKSEGINNYKINGKVVAECDYEVEEIEKFYCCGDIIQTKTMTYEKLLGRSCLTDDEFREYNPTKTIHIKNLHIFDEPRELNDYIHPLISCSNYEENNFKKSFCRNVCSHNKDSERLNVWCDRNEKWLQPITKAPQNMMYCNDTNGNKYILISIRPEWLCKILNGEKTIEVRKKVLKEMLKND